MQMVDPHPTGRLRDAHFLQCRRGVWRDGPDVHHRILAYADRRTLVFNRTLDHLRRRWCVYAVSLHADDAAPCYIGKALVREKESAAEGAFRRMMSHSSTGDAVEFHRALRRLPRNARVYVRVLWDSVPEEVNSIVEDREIRKFDTVERGHNMRYNRRLHCPKDQDLLEEYRDHNFKGRVLPSNETVMEQYFPVGS